MNIVAAFSIIFTSICTGLRAEVCTTPGCFELASFLNKSIDLTVDPCDDFYNFVCGNYIKGLNLTKSNDAGFFEDVGQEAEDKARAELEVSSSDEDPEWLKKVKNLYYSCVDTERLDKFSIVDMKRQLNKIALWPVLDSNWNETDFNWLDVEKKVFRAGLPVDHFIWINTIMSSDDTSRQIIGIDARDHDIRTWRFLEGMDALQSYLEALVGLAVIFGADRQQAEQDMLEVLQFEIALAKLKILGNEQESEAPVPTTISELQETWPYISWLDMILFYFGDNLNITEHDTVEVDAPFYIEKLGDLLSKTPKRVLANYILARVLFKIGDNLNAEARNLTYAAYYTGRTHPSRRTVCYEWVEESMYIAVQAAYVRKYVTVEDKEDGTKMLEMLKEELMNTIEAADWISNSTKIKGVDKVRHITEIVFYPDEVLNDTILNDYFKDLKICPWNLGKNDRAVRKWMFHFQAQMLHQQSAKRWDFHAYTVLLPGAYLFYFGPLIVLMPSLGNGLMFSADRPMYVNLATLGMVVGHELTHSVDNGGRYINATGQTEDWWDSFSEEEYLKRQNALVDEYSTYVEKSVNMTLNAKLEVGEIIADEGGLKIARDAVDVSLQTPGQDQKLPGLEQYSAPQIFWMASSLFFCSKTDLEDIKDNLMSEVHPPDDWRINGARRNSPQFAHDWSCPVGSFMNPNTKVNVW